MYVWKFWRNSLNHNSHNYQLPESQKTYILVHYKARYALQRSSLARGLYVLSVPLFLILCIASLFLNCSHHFICTQLPNTELAFQQEAEKHERARLEKQAGPS